MAKYQKVIVDGRPVKFPAEMDMDTIAEILRNKPPPAMKTPKQLMAKRRAAEYDRQARDEYSRKPDDGIADTLLIGAGKTADSIGAAAKKLYYRATGNKDAEAVLAEEQASNRKNYKKLQDVRPFSSFAGEILPYIASGGLAGGGLAGQAGLGALSGLLDYEDDISTMGGKAVAGGLLSMVPYGVGKGLQKYKTSKIGSTAANRIKLADEMGFKITPGDRLQSDGLRQAEVSMARNPLTSRTFIKDAEKNTALINKVGARSIGEAADTLDENVLNQASSRISSQFEDLIDPIKKIKGDGALLDDLDAVRAMNSAERMTPATKIGQEAYDLVESFALAGEIPTSEYKLFSTWAMKKARQQATDPKDRDILYALKDAMDAAIERQLGPAEREAWKTTRDQYRNLMTMYKPGVVNAGTGDMSATSLANKLGAQGSKEQKAFRNATRKNELHDIARLGQKFKPIVGDSGTPTGSALMKAIAIGATAPVSIPFLLGANAATGAYNKGLPLMMRYPKTTKATAAGLSRGLLANYGE